MKWRISGPARKDLEEIWTYTASTWSIEQADHYVDILTTRMVWLSNNPDLWLVRDEIRPGIFSYNESRHVIFFNATPGLLSIIRVLHDRMDVKRHIS